MEDDLTDMSAESKTTPEIVRSLPGQRSSSRPAQGGQGRRPLGQSEVGEGMEPPC